MRIILNLKDPSGYIAISPWIFLGAATVSAIFGVTVANTPVVKERSKNLGNAISRTLVSGKSSTVDYTWKEAEAAALSIIEEKMKARTDKAEKQKNIYIILLQKQHRKQHQPEKFWPKRM